MQWDRRNAAALINGRIDKITVHSNFVKNAANMINRRRPGTMHGCTHVATKPWPCEPLKKFDVKTVREPFYIDRRNMTNAFDMDPIKVTVPNATLANMASASGVNPIDVKAWISFGVASA